MQAVKFPFRIGVDGRIALATTYPEVVRGQLIDVLMTNHNERVMRADYGSNLQAALFDPADELVRSDAAQQVAKRVATWTPRVILEAVAFSEDQLAPGVLMVDVRYKAGPFEEARQLRMPVLAFLSEESEV